MRGKNIGKVVRQVIHIVGNIFFVLITTACVLVCMSIVWMFRTWPFLTIEELMFQLQSPMEGTSYEMIKEYGIFCVPVTVLFFCGEIILLIFFQKNKKKYMIYKGCLFFFSIVAVLCSALTTWNRLDVFGYIKNGSTYSEFIDNNYIDPDSVALLFPENKRNLIYIFLESMEITYADFENGGQFKDNYIPELNELAMSNEDFSGSVRELNGAVPLSYATWTAAGLFAQTSGLPLKLPIDANLMNTQESFLPQMTALGDILEKAGYEQRFILGSDADFAGRKLYFTDHGKYKIEDYYYFRDLGKFPEDYSVWWGIEDKKIFEYAKEELLDLGSKQTPFNLTILTADTHFEDGYVCDLCDDKYGDNTYANVLSCSSRQVYEFVKWIQQQPFYENTTIVICGDHITMDSDFCKNVDNNYVRKVYNTYINSPIEVKNKEWKREYSTFDCFPTALASLGVQIEGDRLGLGTNLFSDKKTLLETYSIEWVNSNLMKKSELMEEFTANIDQNVLE